MSFFIASIFLRHKYKEAFRNSIHVDGLFQDVFFLMRRARKNGDTIHDLVIFSGN